MDGNCAVILTVYALHYDKESRLPDVGHINTQCCKYRVSSGSAGAVRFVDLVFPFSIVWVATVWL